MMGVPHARSVIHRTFLGLVLALLKCTSGELEDPSVRRTEPDSLPDVECERHGGRLRVLFLEHQGGMPDVLVSDPWQPNVRGRREVSPSAFRLPPRVS